MSMKKFCELAFSADCPCGNEWLRFYGPVEEGPDAKNPQWIRCCRGEIDCGAQFIFSKRQGRCVACKDIIKEVIYYIYTYVYYYYLT